MTSQELLNMAMEARAKLQRGVPLTCPVSKPDGMICGKEPVKYFKHLKRYLYIGFCEEHSNRYPEKWSAFKPVSKDEVVTHEVMDS